MDVRPLLLLAKTISAEHGVNVRFAGTDTARCIYSNGKHIIELPFSAAKNRDLLYRGYIDHEIGHVRFTDFETASPSGRTISALANVFEDEFVERRMGSLFPGSRINLRNLGRTIFTEEHVLGALQTSAVSRLFAFALYHRRSLLDPELGKWNDMIDDSLRDIGVPDDVLDNMLAKVETPSNSTAENIQLGHELYDLFAPYLNRKLPPQDSEQGDSGQEQGDGGQGQGDGGQEPGDGGQEQGDDGHGGKQCLPTITPDDFSVSNRISQELSSGGSGSMSPLELELKDAAFILGESMSLRSDVELMACGVLVEAVLNERLVSALRKRIPALLQSSRIKPCVVSSRGKLYGKRLARAATLDVRVFHAPAKKLEQDMEVGFLLDYSGSMDGQSKTLDQAVYASLVMLKELPKVKAFAYGFNGSCYRELCSRDKPRINSFCGLRPRGCTPLGAAMLNISNAFGTAGRRILIVTTDGRPDRGVDSCREVCALVARMGIEVYGIGIGCVADYLYDLFGKDNASVIAGISEYPACLEAMLRKAMICVN